MVPMRIWLIRPNTLGCPELGKAFYPETFQTKTHEYQWSIIKDHPYIIASYLWNMFDFAVPMWTRGGVPARNMKGLITFDRKTKKDSYFWYKANWSEEPVLYLTQRRNADREKRTTAVTVYSNIGILESILEWTGTEWHSQWLYRCTLCV